jgi:hypothetical protein
MEGTWRFNYLVAHFFPQGSSDKALCGNVFKHTGLISYGLKLLEKS